MTFRCVFSNSHNTLIKLETTDFETSDEVEKDDGACMAIEIAAPVCRWGSAETSQMMNGVPNKALPGEHSLINSLMSRILFDSKFEFSRFGI
jgi:hypothetical protein